MLSQTYYHQDNSSGFFLSQIITFILAAYFEIAPVRSYSKWGFLAKKVFYHRNIWNNRISNIFAVEIHGFISQKYLKIISHGTQGPGVLLRAIDVDVAVGWGGEGRAQLLRRGQRGRAQHRAVRRQRGGVVRVGIWVQLLRLLLGRDLTAWFQEWGGLLQCLWGVELGSKLCQW